MNPDKYSAKTISIYEIIGTYFVDVYYNHLYISARDRYKGQNNVTNSITDEYKNAIIAYVKGIKEDKNYYIKTIKGIHEWFKVNTRFSTIGLSDFIDKFLEEFIPKEHFENLNDKEKEFFLNKIVTDIVIEFSHNVISPDKLSMVIDDHKNSDNIAMWKHNIINIQIMEREKIFSLFMKKITERSEMVPIDLLERLKNEFGKLLKEKIELEIKYKHLPKRIKQYKKEIFEKDKEILSLQRNIEILQNELLKTKKELMEIKTKKLLDIQEFKPTMTQTISQYDQNTSSCSSMSSENTSSRSSMLSGNISSHFPVISENIHEDYSKIPEVSISSKEKNEYLEKSEVQVNLNEKSENHEEQDSEDVNEAEDNSSRSDFEELEFLRQKRAQEIAKKRKKSGEILKKSDQNDIKETLFGDYREFSDEYDENEDNESNENIGTIDDFLENDDM